MSKEIKRSPSTKALLTYWLRKLDKYSAVLKATFEDYREAHQMVINLTVQSIREDQKIIEELREEIKELKKSAPKEE